VFLFKVQTADTQRYKKILIDLSVLEKNTTKINEQVIYAQQGLLRNYDQMFHIVDEMEGVLQRLMKEKYAGHVQGQHEIDTQIGVLGIEFKRLNLAVDHFLSANAVRNHAFIYLVRQMRNFSVKSAICIKGKEINLADRLMQEILFYSRWDEPERKAEIIELSSQLSSSRLPRGLDEKIKLIVAHARVFIHYTDLANTEVEIILSSPVSDTIMLIREKYLNMYQQGVDLVRKIGIAISVLCILLILLQILVRRPRTPKLSLSS
jgi:hypothetical protein